jgi:hypothetical protein
MSKLTSQKLKDFAQSTGLDLLGVANIERFQGAPQRMHPAEIFPEARSVIVTARRITRGVYRGIEEGTLWNNYTFYGYNKLNTLFRPKGTYETACYIEDHGWEAVPCYPGVPEAQSPREPLRPGRAAPDVQMAIRIAGCAAGIGEMGWSKVFLTRRFGPRVRLGMILTDAELEPDPLVTEEQRVCDRCMACVADCPGHCIPHRRDNDTVSVEIEGVRFEWANVDMGKCTLTHHGLNKEASPFLAKDCPGLRLNVSEQKLTEEEAYKLCYTVAGGSWRPTEQFPSGRVIDYYKNMLETTGYYAVCGARGCIRACMMHLEKTGRIEQTFENEFRRRPMWELSWEGEVVGGE